MAPADTIIANYSSHAADVLDGPRGHSSSGHRSELTISPSERFGKEIWDFRKEFGNSQKFQKKSYFSRVTGSPSQEKDISTSAPGLPDGIYAKQGDVWYQVFRGAAVSGTADPLC